MRLLLAIKVFFRILFDRELAERVRGIFAAGAPAPGAATRPKAEPVEQKQPAPRRGRNDSLTLLATLQRESRFVDFIMESLEGLSDAQIGAAVRDVHRDCHATLQRLFHIVPVSAEQEGSETEVARGYDPGLWKLTGNVQGEPPFRGQLTHHGWKAAKCELPEWSGSKAAEQVLAPVEVEVP